MSSPNNNELRKTLRKAYREMVKALKEFYDEDPIELSDEDYRIKELREKVETRK